jgi:hypothetical protein
LSVLFSTKCSACAEREVCFASEAHFVREVVPRSSQANSARYAEHLTSLCANGAILHLGASPNFTAACRNFTIEIFARMWRRQQKFEPLHTTVGFGFIFILCTGRQIFVCRLFFFE